MFIDITNRDRLQVSLTFKGPSFKLLSFSQCQKVTPRVRPETRKPLFRKQESQKKQFCEFFSVKFYDGETCFSSQNYFSQDEISYESEGYLSNK